MALTKHERLEKIEDSLFHLGEALEHVSQVDNCEHLVDIISDAIFVLAFTKEELHKQIEEEEAREQERMTIEFWRMVL